jgi:hypothetical protein
MSDPSASIAVSSIIVDAAPYVVALIPFAIGWLAREQAKFTKVQVSQAQLDKLDTLAKAEAGALIAESKTNLAGVSIPVGSKMITDAADRAIAGAPKALEAVGLTPDAVATMVAGHLGFAQANSPAAIKQ